MTLDEADGIPARCCLALDNVTSIRASLCAEQITSLPEDRLREVCTALSAAAGCPYSVM